MKLLIYLICVSVLMIPMGAVATYTPDMFSAQVYAQLSDSTDQTFGATGTAQSITLNTNDEIAGITHSTTVNPENVTIETNGTYVIIAQPQVNAGAGAAGYFHLWLQVDTGGGFADVSDSSMIADPISPKLNPGSSE